MSTRTDNICAAMRPRTLADLPAPDEATARRLLALLTPDEVVSSRAS